MLGIYYVCCCELLTPAVGVTLLTREQFSGVLKNCACRGGSNRYVDFESADFYKNPKHFDVKVWWVVAAVTAAVPVVLSFLVALPVLVLRLQPLWQEPDSSPQRGQDAAAAGSQAVPLLYGERADTDWVAH